jgi:hypothetical protein
VRLHSWLHFLRLIAFVEYRASLASDFNVTNSMFWGIEVSMFFASVKYRVVKIMCSCSKVVL